MSNLENLNEVSLKNFALLKTKLDGDLVSANYTMKKLLREQKLIANYLKKYWNMTKLLYAQTAKRTRL